MTPRQQAEYRNAIARTRREAARQARAEARAAEDARTKRTYRRARKPKPAAYVPPPPTPAEAALAHRLRGHLCEQSTVDLDQHALNVARTILRHGTSEATA